MNDEIPAWQQALRNASPEDVKAAAERGREMAKKAMDNPLALYDHWRDVDPPESGAKHG